MVQGAGGSFVKMNTWFLWLFSKVTHRSHSKALREFFFLQSAWMRYLVVSNQTTIEFHINLSNRQSAKRKGEAYRLGFLAFRRFFFECFLQFARAFLVWRDIGG